MDIFLIILSGILIFVGFLGCVLPILPGLPIGYIGLLVLHFTDKVQFSTQFLIVWAAIVVVLQVLDSVIPVWGTKKFGGSKKGVWGSTIGLVVGLFFGPWGIVLGPFLGAVAGEFLAGKQTQEAIRAGFGAFVGFLSGTVLKLIAAGFMIYYFVQALV